MPQKLSSYLKKLSSEHLTLKIQGGFISLGYIEMCRVNEQPFAVSGSDLLHQHWML